MKRSNNSARRETVGGKSARSGLRRGAPGYTLLELLLVIGILMIVAGAVTPSVLGMLANVNLKEGVKKVQSALGATRVHAIDATSSYQFRFEPGGRHFLALPTDPDAVGTQGSALTPDGGSLARGLFEAGVLPETLSFQTVAQAGPAPGTPPLPAGSDPGWIASLARMPDAHDFASAAWSDPITFRADGTGTDATFVVQDTRGGGYRFTIREVTGEIFIHPLETESH